MNAGSRFRRLVITAGLAGALAAALPILAENGATLTPLPAPTRDGKLSLEQALARRRSVRRFAARTLTREEISQLCWAAQGVTDTARGFRTAPSAGATYPLELYVVTEAGVERYVPRQHAMKKHLAGDPRVQLQAAALGQPFVGQAPVTFVITAVFARTGRRYSGRARGYVLMEVGHAGQNLLLQATALELGAVPIGAFREAGVTQVLSLPREEVPLYLISVGVPQK